MAHVGGVLVFAATGLLPALAAADEVFATAQSDTGQFSTTVYGWLPVHFTATSAWRFARKV